MLVIYNSQSEDADQNGIADSLEVFSHYQTRRPGVLGFDLSNPDLPKADIDYSQFIEDIRDPLRAHLSANNLEQQVSVLTLTHGLPHRIRDTDEGNIGNNANRSGDEFDDGDATFASVDSELTLMWQSLEVGENGDRADSYSDNSIFNPYHTRTESIMSFDRSQVTSTPFYESLGGFAWQLREGNASGDVVDPGYMMLTARLDGNNVPEIKHMIDRGFYASYNPSTDAVLFDESGEGQLDNAQLFEDDDLGYLGDDYDEAFALLQPKYERVVLNETSDFLVGEGDGFTGTAEPTVVEGNVAVFVSYGGNHDRGGSILTNDGFVDSFAGQWVDGAIMNTTESFNARAFGGNPGFLDQGQLTEFVAGGGSLAIGQVWEPFAFAIADNELLVDNFFFGGMTWVEAAWSSLTAISWQNVVLGDPLAQARIIADSQEAVWHGSGAQGTVGDGVSWADADNWNRGSSVDVRPVVGDSIRFAPSNNPTIVVLNEDQIVESVTFQGDYTLRQQTLVIRSGQIDVDAGSFARIETDIFAGNGVRKGGAGTLMVSGQSSAMVVLEGRLSGNGRVAGLVVGTNGIVAPGDGIGILTVDGNYLQEPSSNAEFQVRGTAIPGADFDQIRISGAASLSGLVAIQIESTFSFPSGVGDSQAMNLISAGMVTGNFDSMSIGGELLTPVFETESESRFFNSENLFHSVANLGDRVTFSSYRAEAGDTDGDGDIDSADRTNVTRNWTGASSPGELSKLWIDGDFDGDGDVDTADNTMLLTTWTGAMDVVVVDEALSAAVSYDPVDGSVVVRASGEQPIISFAVSLAGLEFPENDESWSDTFTDPGTFTDATSTQVGYTDTLGTGQSDFDLGPILPAGLSQQEFNAVVSSAIFASPVGGGELTLRYIPEPNSITLLLFGFTALVARMGVGGANRSRLQLTRQTRHPELVVSHRHS